MGAWQSYTGTSDKTKYLTLYSWNFIVRVFGCVFVFDFFLFLSLPGAGQEGVGGGWCWGVREEEGGELMEESGEREESEREGEGEVVSRVPGPTTTVTMPACAAAVSKTSRDPWM